ncbi:hypothetical protein PISMIDRAFT_501103 [Pisolithus microcarpus 441]|uniref:Uncharacterized protein n=1 Tax=Pisolithus microcarpus 441 TaxID=765257 RepID=A0A0C9Z8W2_9AGAM|nr:hypothetical protein PISMIDRAFT_501103 [Pisolithus microcarpus 441]
MVVIHFGYDDEDNERRRWWHVGVQVARSPHSGISFNSDDKIMLQPSNATTGLTGSMCKPACPK